MTAGHFIFIPSILLIGIVIGWVLGSRAARDAFASELKRREEKNARLASKAERLEGGKAGTEGRKDERREAEPRR